MKCGHSKKNGLRVNKFWALGLLGFSIFSSWFFAWPVMAMDREIPSSVSIVNATPRITSFSLTDAFGVPLSSFDPSQAGSQFIFDSDIQELNGCNELVFGAPSGLEFEIARTDSFVDGRINSWCANNEDSCIREYLPFTDLGFSGAVGQSGDYADCLVSGCDSMADTTAELHCQITFPVSVLGGDFAIKFAYRDNQGALGYSATKYFTMAGGIKSNVQPPFSSGGADLPNSSFSSGGTDLLRKESVIASVAINQGQDIINKQIKKNILDNVRKINGSVELLTKKKAGAKKAKAVFSVQDLTAGICSSNIVCRILREEQLKEQSLEFMTNWDVTNREGRLSFAYILGQLKGFFAKIISLVENIIGNSSLMFLGKFSLFTLH